MPLQVLATLLWGTLPVQVPAASPQAQVASAPPRAEESDATRTLRLRALVEATERALEEGDNASAAARAEEADALTTNWPLELLGKPDVQALVQRLKDAQDTLAAEEPSETEPGMKANEEVVSISGSELKAELERVGEADKGLSYDFPIDLNDKVLTWVNLFSTAKSGFMENALGRASMYLPMIRQVFAEEGIPSDLAYLPVIESGFRNEAKSKAKAVGMWQFIRPTGRIYGLSGSAWVEERSDPVKATRAAARYLKRLYDITGDWYLATASYNAGPLTLDRAIQNLGTRNFWDLYRSRWLRTETKNYVPELCAAILVGRNPEKYGLHVAPLTPYAYESVTVPGLTSLSVLARCAGTDVVTLKVLNPELLRGSTPPGAYALRVPPGRALDCLRQLARMPSGRRVEFEHYTVKKGDSLAKVAKRFKLAPEDLLSANDITAKQFKPGKRLLVPPPPLSPVDERDLDPTKPRRLGDRPLTPLPDLPKDPGGPLTGEEGPRQGPAASLPAAAPAQATPAPAPPVERAAATPAAPAKPQPVVGRVIVARPGDTLAKLSRAHQVPLGELMRLNPEATKALHPGDEVRLPGSAATGAKDPAAPRIHKVQKGETLAAISRKYGLAPEDLKTWNRLKGDRIQAGQKLRLSPR